MGSRWSKFWSPGTGLCVPGFGLADIRFPNQAGYEACLEILDLIDRAGPEDLFLCVMSGGSSALMSCPVDGISLEDEQRPRIFC